jgi:hypothetical protein
MARHRVVEPIRRTRRPVGSEPKRPRHRHPRVRRGALKQPPERPCQDPPAGETRLRSCRKLLGRGTGRGVKPVRHTAERGELTGRHCRGRDRRRHQDRRCTIGPADANSFGPTRRKAAAYHIAPDQPARFRNAAFPRHALSPAGQAARHAPQGRRHRQSAQSETGGRLSASSPSVIDTQKHRRIGPVGRKTLRPLDQASRGVHRLVEAQFDRLIRSESGGRDRHATPHLRRVVGLHEGECRRRNIDLRRWRPERDE